KVVKGQEQISMQDFTSGAAYMNGRIMPIGDASISVTDWGLTHSDITYDVVPVWNGRFFRLDDYLTRFEASMAALRLSVGVSSEEIRKALHAIVAQSGLRQSYVAMVASRGQPLIPGTRDPRHCKNHFYAWCVPYVHVFQPDVVERGAHIHVPDAIRRIPEDSVNPRAKNYHWGDFTEGLFEAKENGFDTVALLDHAGNLTEGPGFNIFAISGNCIKTPARHCLEGITRKTALEIAETLGFETEIGDIPLTDFQAADEVFATTSGGGPVGVARLGTTRFSNDSVGPKTALIRKTYWEWMERPDMTEEIHYA
ncbi:MAG: aminotransferase class IV, partial [Pseudomonadota bacterium]